MKRPFIVNHILENKPGSAGVSNAPRVRDDLNGTQVFLVGDISWKNGLRELA